MDQPATSRRPGGGESTRTCARCGEAMEERKCKIVCANCGFYHDCSDP
ncbi:MAG TPA: hypothetical protein VGR82_06850 [Methylomirabilota bacterium]|nr:hypothetical protein [Methylomirabilota bacterium]